MTQVGSRTMPDPSTRRVGTESETAVRVTLLGPFRVTVGGQVIEGRDWRLRKAAVLVKLLALAPNHRLHREQIIDVLWPEVGAKAAENNLHHTIHVARRTLDPSGTVRALQLEGPIVVLGGPMKLWIDVEDFEAAILAARRSGSTGSYRRALALYTGDLLPDDPYEDWAAERRIALHTLFIRGLIELARLYRDEGECTEAIAALQRTVRAEPALEEAHVELMQLHARAGERQQALRQYEQLRMALARELDTEPDAATKDLYARILAGTTAKSADDESGTRAVKERRHNLTMPLSRFVGRDAAVAELLELAGTCRLLTLTGAGGIGKTRLAGVVALRLLPDFEDGAWMIQLASISDGSLISRSVARTLSVHERREESVDTAVVEALEQKHLLLLLDNCEHLVEPCSHLAELLLRSCPHLRILATSREPLNVPGEVIYTVPPLSLPDPRQLPSLEEMRELEAVQLFLECARARQPGLSLTSENAAAIARICREVGGLPLAIELAAARTSVLSLEGIADRLADAPAFLTGGSRTAEPRQRTLRGTLDWSYNLLSESERRLLQQLSVFAGGWTLDAAEAVGGECGADSEPVLDLLSGLVDRSLVMIEPAAGAEEVRYRMLEPVRQYARAHLVASGRLEQTERRHGQFFTSLVECAQREVRGADQAVWLDRLDAEHDNLRAALRYSIEQREAETGLRIVGSVWRFWAARGHITEGRRWLSQLFALPESDGATESVRAAALHTAGVLAYYQGDYADAARQYERELVLRRNMDDTPNLTILLSNLGLVAKEQGEYDRARQLHEEALALALDIGDTLGQAANLNNLGILEQDSGHYEQAARLHARALTLQRERDDRRGIMITLNNLGAIALEQGDYALVSEYAGGALAIARDLGHVQSTLVARANLGLASMDQGNFGAAREHLEEVIRLAVPIGDKRRLIESLEYLAMLANAERQYRRMATLYGAATALRATSGMEHSLADRPRLERSVAAAKKALGQDTFESALAVGRRFTMEQALEYAAMREDVDELAAREKLTAREREIASLVARGLTNRQIGQELSIAERTVDTHLQNILSKLGVSSRTEIRAF